MTSDPFFDILIAQPLTTAMGEPLLAVNYWVLNCDCPTFETDSSNASGIAKIDLEFRTTTLEVTWGWEKRLRSGGAAYHLQISALKHQGDEGLVSQVWNSSGLCRVNGSQAEAWVGAVGTPLTGVEVYGLAATPQAVRFAFSKSGIVVATGYAGEELIIGDGDELLAFSDSEWQSRGGRNLWSTLWTASSVSHPLDDRSQEYATTSRS